MTQNEVGVLQARTGSFKESIKSFRKSLAILQVYSGDVATMLHRFDKVELLQLEAEKEIIALSNKTMVKVPKNESGTLFNIDKIYQIPEKLVNELVLVLENTNDMIVLARFFGAVFMSNLSVSMILNADPHNEESHLTIMVKECCKILDGIQTKNGDDDCDTEIRFHRFFLEEASYLSSLVKGTLNAIETKTTLPASRKQEKFNGARTIVAEAA